jgi:hypothetical protein
MYKGLACKSRKKAVSRTATIIVNQNCPPWLSDVQLTPLGISTLFSAKVWWGLVKNCLACGPYNLWKLPKISVATVVTYDFRKRKKKKQNYECQGN